MTEQAKIQAYSCTNVANYFFLKTTHVCMSVGVLKDQRCQIPQSWHNLRLGIKLGLSKPATPAPEST